MNKCIFLGRLILDPDVRYSAATKSAVVNFAVAVNREYKNKETGKYDSDIINCIAFDKRGEVIGNSFKKGDRILVWGAIRQEKWQDKDGNNRTTYKLHVEGFDFIEPAKEKSMSMDSAVAAAQKAVSSFDGLGEDIDF